MTNGEIIIIGAFVCMVIAFLVLFVKGWIYAIQYWLRPEVDPRVRKKFFYIPIIMVVGYMLINLLLFILEQ